jgi:hypothetical protein
MGEFGNVGSNPVSHYIISKANVDYDDYKMILLDKLLQYISTTINGKKIYFQNERKKI